VTPVHLALYLDALLADHLDPHPPTVLFLQGSLAAVPSRVVSLQSCVQFVLSQCTGSIRIYMDQWIRTGTRWINLGENGRRILLELRKRELFEHGITVFPALQ
jgi:hypothetical protein